MSDMQNVIMDTWDALLAMKIDQAAAANKHRGEEVEYHVGDLVMLSTDHRCKNLRRNG